jgi:hypothetical protein
MGVWGVKKLINANIIYPLIISNPAMNLQLFPNQYNKNKQIILQGNVKNDNFS